MDIDFRSPAPSASSDFSGIIGGKGVIIQSVLVFAFCYIGLKIEMFFTFSSFGFPAFRPFNAILAAVLLSNPHRRWSCYLSAGFLAQISVQLPAGFALAPAVYLIAADFVEILTLAILLRHFASPPFRPEGFKQMAVYMLIGVLLAPAFSAFFAAWPPMFDHSRIGYFSLWRRWFFTDALTHLTLTPFILLVSDISIKNLRKQPPISFLEAVILAVPLISSVLFGTGMEAARFSRHPALLFLPLPFIIWVTIRYGLWGGFSAANVLTFSNLYAAANGLGPFGPLSITQNVLNLQFYLLILLCPILFLSALIEERKHIETILRENQEQFRILFEQAAIGIAHTTMQGRFLRVNSRFRDLLGYDRKEFDTLTIKEITHPDDFRLEKETLDRLIAGGGQRMVMDKRFCRKDGTWMWGRVTVSIVRDINGTPEYCIGSMEDITERKLMEENLRHSQTELDSIVKTSPDIIYRLDQEGRITFISEAVKKYGYSPEELIGTRFVELVHPEDRPAAEYKVNERRTGDRCTRGLEIRLITKNDEPVFLETRSEPIGSEITLQLDAYGLYNTNSSDRSYFIGTQGIARDISERKLAEAERKALDEQLRQLQKMEAIGTLAGGIAHDFNNILQSIIINTELSLMDLSDGKSEPHRLKSVLKASSRAKDLVNQILTFSRQDKQQRKPLQLRIVIKEVLKMLRASLPTTIEIKQDLGGDFSDLVLADPTQIHQVMMNLCTNAAHAMRDSGGRLEIGLAEAAMERTGSTCDDLNADPCIRLTITDTGHGMPPKIKERIFDPFFTTKNRGEGTGMGLAVVHGIVQSYAGTISVESEPGKGAKFEILLPRIETDILPEPGKSPPLPHGTERLLIVDDEVMLVELLKGALERLGYTAIVRSSSIEALEAFRARPDRIDLVITDQTMPKMTGAELSKEIKRLRPDIPIILCTGFSETLSDATAKTLGVHDLLMKPIVLSDLAVTIRKVLDKRPHR